MLWINECPFVLLAVIVQVRPSDELFIKNYQHLFIGSTNNGSSKSKWNVFSLTAVDVHNSVTNSKIF
jgi:hypothetical protein